MLSFSLFTGECVRASGAIGGGGCGAGDVPTPVARSPCMLDSARHGEGTNWRSVMKNMVL